MNTIVAIVPHSTVNVSNTQTHSHAYHDIDVLDVQKIIINVNKRGS